MSQQQIRHQASAEETLCVTVCLRVCVHVPLFV